MRIRRPKRIILDLNAEVIVDGKSYAGFIGNISDDGIYMKILSSGITADFHPGNSVDLKFQLPAGEKLNLPCIIKWVNKSVSNGHSYSMGLKIHSAPQEYKEFLSGRVRL